MKIAEQELMTMSTTNARSNYPRLAAAVRATSLEPIGLMCCAVAIFVLTGCTTIPRLDAKFDTNTLGVTPASSPPPTPPKDVLVWRDQTFFTTTVVANPASGRWVNIKPLPAFTTSPDGRRVFLIASTEPFTTSPAVNIRGSLQIRLDSLGTVGMGVRLEQGGSPLDYLGGFELSNFLSPTPSQLDGLQTFTAARFNDFVSLTSSGRMSGYNPGSVIDINWTIDQASRTFTASVPGGPIASTHYPANFGSIATTPIQQLMLFFWVDRPTTATSVFIDNLYAEEYQ
jgi:hypothetical protein